ncbi:hypothetical protein [Crassaminicella profunda]|uniref:hypothetical protein n=1 Tax=Crassaminicella profunda TaxID=1286698 RepID=UPI001CA65FAB|nr:hypothetical protein [Crassaminicella profunda]QZY55201.1 hypothetical protein K7H06_19715 [Crassaminicella profunda]
MKKIVVLILILTIGMSIAGCGKKDSQASLSDLKAMPEFSLKDINDQDVSNKIFEDKKFTLVNIWSTG